MTSSITPATLIHVAPGLSLELVDNGAIQIVRFADGDHSTLDNWVAFTQESQSQQNEDNVVYLCMDIRQLKNALDPYFVQRAREVMVNQGQQPIYVALLVKRDLNGDMIRMDARVFPIANHAKQRLNTFFTVEDAIRWLRVSRQKQAAI